MKIIRTSKYSLGMMYNIYNLIEQDKYCLQYDCKYLQQSVYFRIAFNLKCSTLNCVRNRQSVGHVIIKERGVTSSLYIHVSKFRILTSQCCELFDVVFVNFRQRKMVSYIDLRKLQTGHQTRADYALPHQLCTFCYQSFIKFEITQSAVWSSLGI